MDKRTWKTVQGLVNTEYDTKDTEILKRDDF